MLLYTVWILVLTCVAASPVDPQSPLLLEDSRSALIGWGDPRVNGGRLLDFTDGDLGEPLNIIISNLSDPYVLTDTGFNAYAKSLGYSAECLGLHYGHRHQADLGDGDDRKIELIVARQHYFPVWGTCWESLAGGQHFRAWKQNGTAANSGAWFIGASQENDSRRNHMIVPNGYNLGRNWFVRRAKHGTNWQGRWWKAEVEWITGLLEEGDKDVNHGISQDGRVAVLRVVRV
ncbi:hypothetical protein FA15DRAFT_670912 [Coprinopsis marcescibilis]|uniref:Secreted protein n=1 Tax=Coprinopsis marcescibilis TaxID=230819 RepID=A0A5C3KTB2_COPMA|nr:hypothetical protein FA15DRAFT_670912 [Coprinopsis marcescibilis]